MDGSERDQAGNTAPNDSTIDNIFGQDTWNNNGAYGLNAEAAVNLFDNSFMETIQNCPKCTPITVKGLDNEDNRTKVGLISGTAYQEILSRPPYNLNINITHNTNAANQP